MFSNQCKMYNIYKLRLVCHCSKLLKMFTLFLVIVFSKCTLSSTFSFMYVIECCVGNVDCVALGRLSDDVSEDSTSVSSAPRHFRSKLEEALTAKQEFEAKVSTLDEKVKQYEAEIADLRLRVRFLLSVITRYVCWHGSVINCCLCNWITYPSVTKNK